MVFFYTLSLNFSHIRDLQVPQFKYFCMRMQAQEYQIVIGLEVHAQMSTNSKLFCADETGFGAEPNVQVSEVSLAHPGTLPVLNEKVITLATRLGLALQCEIGSLSYFA